MLLDVVVQLLVGDQLRSLRAASHEVRLPLRNRRSILEPAASCSRIATQLTSDRRGITAEVAGDLADTTALGSRESDLLALSKGQVATGEWSELDRWHPATLAEPTGSSCR